MRIPTIIFWVIALGACVPREGPPVGTHAANYSTPMDSVALLDDALAADGKFMFTDVEAWRDRGISIEQHAARRTPTGSMETLVMVRNRLDAPLALELRTTFYDRDSIATGSASEWQVLSLPPKGTDRYREVSLEPNAAHYYVEVRLAHRR